MSARNRYVWLALVPVYFNAFHRLPMRVDRPWTVTEFGCKTDIESVWVVEENWSSNSSAKR